MRRERNEHERARPGHDDGEPTGTTALEAPQALPDDDVCYRALSSRDRRFDGKFFTAVRTTGIYCRPVCPAQTPKRGNVQFYAAAAAAEAAGFRPCLRCRPETAPGTPAWLGTSATVARALRLIEAGTLDEADVEQLAARVGIGERHLRRLFLAHLGVSPIAVAQTRRVQLAKQLLDETALPMTRIAMDAGFGSLRRFNFALRETYGRSPRELRRERPAELSTNGNGLLSLKLAYRPPFAWNDILAFLAVRATPGVEHVADGAYLRRIRHGRATGVVRIEHDAARARIVLSIPTAFSPVLSQVLACARRTFDLSADPHAIARTLSADPTLVAHVRRCRGLRVPGAWDPFEIAVRAIVGQQISVAGATTIMGRIAQRAGKRCGDEASAPHLLFPSAETLADADLSKIGMPAARSRAIRELARAVASGRVALDGSRALDETMAALQSLAGIGSWTAAYIAMRALGEPDAFPAGDLGVRRALAKRNGDLPSAAEVTARAEVWRPWRAYATLHLWIGEPAASRGKRAAGAESHRRTRRPRLRKEESRATAA